MSFGLQDPGNYNSAALINQKGNHALTGSQMAALTTVQKKKGVQVMCTLTESGFTANHLYMVNAAEDGWVDLGLIAHTHLDATTGGSLYNIMRTSQHLHHEFNAMSPNANMFFQNTGSGGSVTNSETNVLQISTSTTLNGFATASLLGVKPGFVSPSFFHFSGRVTSNTNFTNLRIGIGAEHANETNTSSRKYLIEGCSSSGVNWLVGSADNTTRSTVSTTTGVAQGVRDSYIVENTLSSITVKFNGTTIATKTLNLPVTGQPTTDQSWFRMGIKNTAAEQKEVYCKGLRTLAVIEDSDWVQG